jgi:hypothetical protein
VKEYKFFSYYPFKMNSLQNLLLCVAEKWEVFKQKYDDTTFTGILVGTGQRMLRFLFDETLAGFPFSILQVSCISQLFNFFSSRLEKRLYWRRVYR